MTKQKVLLALFLFFTLHLFSQSKIALNSEAITKIINQNVSDDSPGIAVGIVKDGAVVYEHYRGYANLAHKVNVSKNTRFNIASTAKQFTALMILQLSLQEKISLEDDIRKHLPTLYPDVKEEIKIRQLINHTSGIRDYVELMSLQNKTWWQQVGLDNEEVMELLEKQEELAFKPGSQYTYSNSGYNVLAKIIEKVSGEKFTDYSKQFFTGLGMKETSFVERYMGVIPNRADPYADWGSGEWFQSPTVTKTSGEGFLFTTLKDQLIYEQAVQNANQSNNALLIKSQQPIPNSEIETYGFGLKLENRLNRTAVHHDGATYGYHSQTIRFPKEKLTIFIMSNNGNIRSDLIADEIASVFLPAIEGKEKYDSRFYESLSSTKKPQVLGQYNYPNGGNLVRIIKKEGKTYWKEGNYNALEMTPQGENKYAFVYDPTLKVVFYENEMVEFYSSGKTMRYKRNEDLPASLADLEGFVGEYYSSELEVGFELKLTADHKLNLLFSNRERVLEVEVLNQNELLANNFRMRIQRDPFDRVTDVLLSLGRAKNNRFKKKTNLKFQPKIETEHGSIQVTTIGSKNNDKSDILLTKNYPNGNEIWYKQFGGSSYDKASSILATEDGYLIIGSTSSYGNGNYDMLVIKTDKKGKKQWQNTYGGFYNEYGYTAEETKDGYLIKGTKQNCTSNSDVFNRKCTTNVWFVSIDKKGKEISSKILEKI